MAGDILAEMPQLFLGSRLKRLSERLLGDAAQVIKAAGLPIQPAHFPLLAMIDRHGPTTVTGLTEALGISQPSVTRSVRVLIDLGLIEAGQHGRDLRIKPLRLTVAGAAVVTRGKAMVWPPVIAAVSGLCEGLNGDFIGQIAAMEARLDAKSLLARVGEVPGGLVIRDYDDALAADFERINAEWITAMFSLEANDRAILSDPRGAIIDPGGVILFVESAGKGIIGTCALLRQDATTFELTKMGVTAAARGLKAGEFLLAATIARAAEMRIETLYLLTSRKCEAAIHLYEKLGFQHDAEIMARYGSRYARCDVAMAMRPPK